jgi:protein-S-isoprenylcysteine O-methyltransferase Ste14
MNSTHNAEGGERLSLLGDAGRLVVRVGPIVAAAVVATVIWPESFRFLGKLWGVGIAGGIVLAAVGFVFWASAARGLVRAYADDRLAKRGAYGLCRHPIFAWWIFFILPPAALITNSWLFLVAAFLAIPSMRREDSALAARYGEEHGEYARRVRALVPIPRLLPLTPRRVASGVALVAVVGIASVVAFYAVVRPVMLGLGVSAAEARAALPGDEYLTTVRSGYTQAIEIDSSPEEVWPWLVQIGYRRAGWYNVDAINRLADSDYFYEGGASARRIIPELQDLSVGDMVYVVPQLGMEVVQVTPPQRLLLVGNPGNPGAPTNAAWLFELHSLDSEPDGDTASARGAPRTRLMVRFSSTFPGGLGARLANGFVNEIGGAIIQQPAMLHGIRARAEG